MIYSLFSFIFYEQGNYLKWIEQDPSIHEVPNMHIHPTAIFPVFYFYAQKEILLGPSDTTCSIRFATVKLTKVQFANLRKQKLS